MAKTKNRLSKQDWAAKGLELLGRKGVGALRIDELCQHLKVTKGSFYWHFKGRTQFLTSVLNHWKQIATLDIIDRLEKHDGSPSDKIQILFEEANLGIVDFSAEQAIRHWAHSNKQASQAVLNVDMQRIDFLAQQFKALNHAKQDADTRARMLYSLIISEAVIYQREKPAKRRQRQRSSFEMIVGSKFP